MHAPSGGGGRGSFGGVQGTALKTVRAMLAAGVPATAVEDDAEATLELVVGSSSCSSGGSSSSHGSSCSSTCSNFGREVETAEDSERFERDGTFGFSRLGTLASLESLLEAGSKTRVKIQTQHTKSRIRRESVQALDRAVKGGPTPQMLDDGTPVTAKYWGITRGQMKKLLERCRSHSSWDDNDSVNDFVVKFVRPATEGTGLGLALHMNREHPQEVTLMVSHAWTENALQFFQDLFANMYDHEVAYVCFLSNYQGTPEEIDSQLGSDIDRSPFTEVIRNTACQRMLVIPNEALRKNGQGLYSRLWCDWEIKVAADAGIPIHIPTRNTLEHLLGRQGGSSRHARCGDPLLPRNKDEVLIRKAIEEMPPETARSQAVGVLLVSVCTAYAPPLFYRWRPLVALWIAGFAGGMLVGLMLAWCISRCMRPRRRDGYEVLDKVITGAASGLYSFRRLRSQDLMVFAAWLTLCGTIDASLRWMVFKKGIECRLIGFIEGGGFGFVVCPILQPNMFGPWTGVFVASPTGRHACRLLLLVSCVVGSVLDATLVRTRSTLSVSLGRGCCMGWMAGLFFISAFWAQCWRHMLGLAFMFVAMLTMRWFHTGLWRESLMLLLGLGAVQVRADWGLKNRVMLISIELIALVGMVLLACVDQDDAINEEDYLAPCSM